MRITPGVAPRLEFHVLNSDGTAKTDLAYTDFTTAKYVLITAGVAGGASSDIGTLSAGTPASAKATGTFGTIVAADGYYFLDYPVGAAPSTPDTVVRVELELTDGTLSVIPTYHVIDYEVSTRSTQASVDTIDGIVDVILLDTDELQTNQGSWLTATGFAVAGDAMTLTSGERSTLAGAIDLAIINQGDGADLIAALANAIAADWVAGDASPLAIVAAMKADATLATMISRVDENVSAAKTLTGAYDSAKTAASQTSVNQIDAIASKLDTALEDDGASGWQFTTLALANVATSGGATPETFWNYTRRTLTQSQAASQDTGSNARFNLEGGYNWQIPLTIGELATWTALWFTLKLSRDDADADAVASILLSNPGDAGDGLQLLNGDAATAENGSITVNDATTGEIVIDLLAVANVQIASNEGRPYYWDVKKIISEGSAVKGASGVLTTVTGITRAS